MTKRCEHRWTPRFTTFPILWVDKKLRALRYCDLCGMCRVKHFGMKATVAQIWAWQSGGKDKA